MARCILVDEKKLYEIDGTISEVTQNLNKARRMILDILECYFDYILDEKKGIEKLKQEHEEQSIKANIAYDYIKACTEELKTIEDLSQTLRI
ncbi:hypothetical protein [Acetobacterium wieringae]|uniref:hypothetical protein n=1 Tax=Acetobacterium wieringae TaxID=52694 RepID=UPI002B210AFB|nr:hypothetical protein [Acetobacterium wieringae]MEA4805240.1 hypothetical protein [Acetobacterium wieringae]